MDKSPDAFRTISEVAESLDTPAHVLRFWESRFPQIKPVKRAGGRRYYRPADVALRQICKGGSIGQGVIRRMKTARAWAQGADAGQPPARQSKMAQST